MLPNQKLAGRLAVGSVYRISADTKCLNLVPPSFGSTKSIITLLKPEALIRAGTLVTVKSDPATAVDQRLQLVTVVQIEFTQDRVTLKRVWVPVSVLEIIS